MRRRGCALPGMIHPKIENDKFARAQTSIMKRSDQARGLTERNHNMQKYLTSVFCFLSAFVFCSALLFAANKKQTANSDTPALKCISGSARTRLEQLRAKAGFPGATLTFVSARTHR